MPSRKCRVVNDFVTVGAHEECPLKETSRSVLRGGVQLTTRESPHSRSPRDYYICILVHVILIELIDCFNWDCLVLLNWVTVGAHEECPLKETSRSVLRGGVQLTTRESPHSRSPRDYYICILVHVILIELIDCFNWDCLVLLNWVTVGAHEECPLKETLGAFCPFVHIARAPYNIL